MARFDRNIFRVSTIISFGLIRHPRLKLLARKTCSRFFRFLLKIRCQPYRCDCETVTAVLAPHPDDEVLGCGGLIARKRLEGLPVHVIYITDGGASHPNHPVLTPESLIALREQEARSAMSTLGMDSSAVHFLGAPDGTLGRMGADEKADLSLRLGKLLLAIAPGEILTPCRRDGSSEHEAVHGLLQHALAGTARSVRLYEYPVWAWWNPLLLAAPLFRARRVIRHDFTGYESIKKTAIACYKSQTLPTPPSSKAALPTGFVDLFQGSEEFFFEV
ncbi:MAG TPA: PIG-L family deacetylase [Rariglobus sp.]|jgi:LmbE family N-acetylglucosaminyl deacetylase|nr:PIG-L family deacetylase [Rariglobus sp.]